MHHHFLHTDILNKGMIGLHSLFKIIGSSFVAIFIPALLYTQFGFSIGQVFLFTAVHSVIAIGLQYWISAGFIAKQGTKPSMILGVVAFMIYMVLLGLGENYPRLILITPIFSGIHTAFFWLAYHVSLATSAKEKDLGKKVAGLESVGALAAIIGPVVGGVLTDAFGSQILFAAASLFILASVVPLRIDDHVHRPVDWNPRKQGTFASESFRQGLKKYFPLVVPFSGLGYTQFVGSIVWSIVLFLHFDSFTKVGILSSLTSIFVIIAVWWMGKSSDEHNGMDHSLMKRAVRIQATTRGTIGVALLTSFFSNVVFMMADAFHKITYKLSTTYLNKQMYSYYSDESDHPIVIALKKALLHEAGIHLFRAIMCVILAMVSVFIDDTLFFFAIPILLVILFIPMQLSFPKDVKQIEA